MKNLPYRTRSTAPWSTTRARGNCSLVVLAALGALLMSPPVGAQSAGGALAARTLPVVRNPQLLLPGGDGNISVSGPASSTAAPVLTVRQNELRGIVDWKSFNIAGGSEVVFAQQQGAGSATLNRVYGIDPSIIQGKLSVRGAQTGVDPKNNNQPLYAPGGQVILINQNGILFDRGTQINVRSLVASTLNLDDQLFNTGAFIAGGLTTPAFAGGYDDSGKTLATRPDGTQPGVIGIGSFGSSSAAAPRIAADAGGTVLLAAPRIDNESGLITAPDGQIILAAGSKVYLDLPAATDSALRGLRVEVEAPSSSNLNLSNLIRNSGTLSAERGNVTLAALTVNQEGRVSASTAIQANGSVYLKAGTLSGGGGSVNLTAKSVTEVTPDAADTATLPESLSFADRRSTIAISGKTLNSSGTLRAAGGNISLTASDTKDPAGASVYLGSGSVTSVAGNWADVDYASNLLTFKVTSNELKDAPDQKTGVLKGATVTVDLRQGSTLLDLSGYVAAQARTVAQKTALGGDLNITSSGALIQRSGATLDAAGGGYRYGSGQNATSVLLGNDGKSYSITTAPQQRTYTAVLDSSSRTDARWGQTVNYTGLLNTLAPTEAGYLQGLPGGNIRLMSAAGLVLDGTLAGGVTIGPRQLSAAPRAATLTLGSYNSTEGDFDVAQRIGNIRFAQQPSDTLGTAFTAGSALSAAQRDTVTLAASQLFGANAGSGAAGVNTIQQSAFDAVEINANGSVLLPAGVSLQGAAGSSLALRAPQIDIAGSISLPAGNLTLTPQATSKPLSADLGPGHNSVTVRSTASLSTAGLWINNASADGSFVGDAQATRRLNIASDGSTSTTSMLDGGSVTITAGDGTSASVLERGAQVDVGGGAALSSARKLTLGNGGKIGIANGQSSLLSADWLGGSLSGLSPGKGGVLALSTPRVVIAAEGSNGLLPANTTRLGTALFSDRGFSEVGVTATQGVSVEASAQIVLRQQNLVIDPLTAAALPTGLSLRSVATASVLPADQRSATDLKLTVRADPAFPGKATLTVAQNASITGDAGAKATLTAVDGLRMDGRISLPGGTVSLNLNPTLDGAPDLSLGSQARIDVSGTFIPLSTAPAGLLQGSVVDAGSISLNARLAGVNLASGSRLALDGAAQTVDVAVAGSATAVQQQTVYGNAGNLFIGSQGSTQLAGSLSARAPTAQSAGGSYALELTQPYKGDGLSLATSRLVVTQGSSPLAADPTTVDATVAVNTLQSAGFQKLRLLSENAIEFRGSVNADFARGIRLDAPLIDVLGNAGVALKSASAIWLGQSLDPRGSGGTVQPGAASPLLATRSGQGLLTAQAGSIDLAGSLTLNGVAETTLRSSGDIRLSGRAINGVADTDRALGQSVGGLTTAGNLTLDAAQVYPTTRSSYSLAVAQPDGSVVSGGYVHVQRGATAVAGDVYSADGSLTVNADVIVQGGTLKAPLGALNLQAASLLDLGAGSITSVSASGLTVPFGATRAGLDWSYQDKRAGGTPNVLLAGSADSKRLTLNGRSVNVNASASVDLSGGGDVQAVEFVPGNGGSVDTFSKAGTYAIIPKSKLASMPLDTDTATRYARDSSGKATAIGTQSSTLDSNVYDSLHIGPGAAVPEGDYVLLPGRYALLPDAYLVQLQTGSAYANLQAGQAASLANGQTMVAGYRTLAGTGIRESRSVGVVLRAGSAATRESDYTVSTSSYFTDLAARTDVAAPRIPLDAGRLAITGAQSLSLAGTLNSAPARIATARLTATGRNAEVDISADRIAVVDQVGSTAFEGSVLQLEGAQLSKLGGSLLLGGERRSDGGTTTVATRASSIVVANSAAGALSGAEVMLTATDSIELRSGSVVAGTGTPDAQVKTVQTTASGALLRVAAGGQVLVDRGSVVDASRGDIRVAAGATLKADGALLLDATRSTQSSGTLAVAPGASVALASSQVSLGATAGVAGIASGLVLSNADLAGLAQLNALVLKGYQGIDLYGSTALGASTLGSLTLDAPALRGVGTATSASRVAARQLLLRNSSAATGQVASASAGTLDLDAQTLTVGAGSLSISGYNAVNMAASSQTVARGGGALTVAGDWTLATPKVAAAAGAVQTWTAADTRSGNPPIYGALRLQGSSGAAGTSVDGDAGGRLSLQGRSVSVGTLLQARSGTLALSALGGTAADGVTLASGALLDASGAAKDYNGHVVTADAGRVALTAAAGTVDIAAGAAVQLNANAQGGNAGELAITASRLSRSGRITAVAGADGAGGRLALDLGADSNAAATVTALAQGGFGASVDLRLRNGDIVLSKGSTLSARQIQLAADNGLIDIAGTLDASSSAGSGSVKLWAGQGLALDSGSLIDARGTGTGSGAADALSNGGQVHVTTTGGTMSFAPGAVIDVSPGAKGSTGSVTFTVKRDPTNAIAPVLLAGTVKGRQLLLDRNTGLPVQQSGSKADTWIDAEVVLEAQRNYVSSGSLNIAAYAADHQAFLQGTNAAAYLGDLRNGQGQVQGNSSLRGATQVSSSGSLSLSSNWDLTSAPWLTAGLPGTLTLRSAGDLSISAALGSPNDNILAGLTWGLRLVGGADLSAANPLAARSLAAATASGTGSVILSGNAAKVRTGTGSIEVAAAADFRMTDAQAVLYTAGRIGADDTVSGGNNRWARQGGDISIRAGGNASGASDEWITEWLRRPRVSTGTPEWWAYRPNFQQGLGTLGGGNITVLAGKNIDHLSAMLPTTARLVTDSSGQRSVAVQGGGRLTLRAGNDLLGGSYLVARGDGLISAAGTIGDGSPTQLFLMGASSGDVPAHAAVALAAGSGITLQSVNNPTAVRELSATGGSGPSFGSAGGTRILSFFSYSPDSGVAALALSGNVGLGTRMAPAHQFGKAATVTLSDNTTASGAYPASLSAVALAGDVSLNLLPEDKGRLLYTYPSAQATLALLASGSVLDPQLTVSDRLPAALPSVANFNYGTVASNYFPSTAELSGDALVVQPADGGALAKRSPAAVSGGYAADVQALTGVITSTGADARTLKLPMQSRIEAGSSIRNLTLVLQNLNDGDLTQVRSDNGDVLPAGLRIGGPGRLLVQAGRNVDVGAAGFSESGSNLGGLIATGNTANGSLSNADAARISVLAGVKGKVNLAALDTAYAQVIAQNGVAEQVLAFYRALNADPDPAAVRTAADVPALVARDAAYRPYLDLGKAFPQVLALYQATAKAGTLPLGSNDETRQAAALYTLLNRETNVAAIVQARNVADLVQALPDGASYAAYAALDAKYPRVLADYRQRRSKGGLPEGLTPILYADLLAANVAQAVPAGQVGSGSIYTFQSSIQTYGSGSSSGQGSVDLWAPGGGVVAGLTTPSSGTTIGVVTNAGGAIRSVVRDDFTINQGKVITAQGGDILVYSTQGSIDAGKGARTSISTPPPKKTALLDPVTGAVTGYVYTLPAGAGGSGIQSLTSDPDGLGPLAAPPAGSIYLTAPGGTIDAGEAGIRSGGNIVVVAATVRNGDSISAQGSSQGVPKVEAGSAASSLATTSAGTGNASKAAEEAAAASAARAPAATAPVAKPTILSVEVLGFGDKNCKEDDKNCFGK